MRQCRVRSDFAGSDNTSFGEISGYLERQYDDILAMESRIKRNPRFRDNRVHALLYFITPTGHGYVERPCSVCPADKFAASASSISN